LLTAAFMSCRKRRYIARPQPNNAIAIAGLLLSLADGQPIDQHWMSMEKIVARQATSVSIDGNNNIAATPCPEDAFDKHKDVFLAVRSRLSLLIMLDDPAISDRLHDELLDRSLLVILQHRPQRFARGRIQLLEVS
jgi:hypothetical protein